MRILFAGSPAIAVPSLEAVAEAFEVVGVLTNPDKRRGRGKRICSTEVKCRAEELGIPVLQFDHLYKESRDAVRALRPDILVSFAYGRIFGPKFLELFPSGGINVHPSLLPRHRGCAPIAAAIQAGDEKTGISVQRIALSMDTGDLLDVRELPLRGDETTESLSADVAVKSPEILVSVLKSIEEGTAVAVRQSEEGVSYCSMLDKSQAEIDWHESAAKISGKIRAFYPWPKAVTEYDGRKLMITHAVEFTGEIPGVSIDENTLPGTVLASTKRGILICAGTGIISASRLQLQSKKEMDHRSFLNGNPSLVGSVLT